MHYNISNFIKIFRTFFKEYLIVLLYLSDIVEVSKRKRFFVWEKVRNVFVEI